MEDDVYQSCVDSLTPKFGPMASVWGDQKKVWKSVGNEYHPVNDETTCLYPGLH